VEQHNIIRKSVPRGTFTQIDELIAEFRGELESYLEKLLWWNNRVNLVSRDVPRETIWEHIRHSLLLSSLELFQKNKLFLDTGTGGGLPGLPLAITHPDKHFVLNDLVTKKCLAIKQIARDLGLNNIGIIDGSIEDLYLEEECTLVSKHAFKIGDLIEMTSHLSWEKMVLYKGLDFEDELKNIAAPINITCLDLSSGSDFYSGKAIIIVEKY
jgi:16S rRNA (guanine527-N7)-methyltransferase